MPRIVAAVCALALAATVALGGLVAPASEGPTGSPPAEERAGPPLLLASTADGPAWTAGADGGPGGAFGLGIGLDTDLTWDLTGLDPAGYRSDLVTVTLVEVRGSGRLLVEGSSPFGAPEVLIDSTDGPGSVFLQIGRTGTLRWTFDQPGAHEVDLTATVPVAGGGIARADATYHLDVTPTDRAPLLLPAPTPVPEPARVPPADTAPAEAFGAGASSGSVRAAPAGRQVVIDDGHVDMGPRIVDGAWRVQLKDDSVSPLVWRDLADVVLHARDASRLEVPPGDAFAFLGAPGSTVHVLPQVQQPGLVWPGWNTQDPSVLDAVPGPVTWRLTGVDGPGRFVLYLAGSFGDTDVLFDTANALPQQLLITRNTHVHGNWAFTAPGVYRLTVQMDATSGRGTSLSDSRILTIVVGDGTDPSTAFTPDPGGAGTSVPGSPGGADAPGPADDSMEISVDTGTGGSGGGRGPGGVLASTGLAGLARKLALAAVLVALGSLLAAVRRRRLQIQIESHSHFN